MDDALELAQYQMITWHHGRKMVRMRNGERSVIFLKFDFRRAIGFYILQVVCWCTKSPIIHVPPSAGVRAPVHHRDELLGHLLAG